MPRIGTAAVAFFLLCLLCPSARGTKCGHQLPRASEVSHAASNGYTGHSVSKRQTYQAIRISPFYLSTVDALTTEQQALIKSDIVPELITFLQNTLSVVPHSGNVLLSRQCNGNQTVNPDSSDTTVFCVDQCEASKMCGPIVTIPAEHLSACRSTCSSPTPGDCQGVTEGGVGVANADFVLYIAVDGSSPCGGPDDSAQVIAFASHCQLDKTTDRPVAGYANICPSALTKKDLKSTVKHELLHAMGFSSQLFPFWRNPDGTARTSRNSQGNPPISGDSFVSDAGTVRTMSVTRSTANGQQSSIVNFLVTETVRAEARAHFNCPSLIGAELENQGGSATALSHWEKRIFENEAMTGLFTQNPTFSRITLAALQDSGWYMVNYAYAMPFRFGQGLGCDFTDNSCYGWWNGRSSPLPYCTVQPPVGSTGRTDCTPDYFSVGRCSLTTFIQSLPAAYRYFANAAQGSSVQIADYCPFYQEFSFDTGRATRCSSSTNQPSDRFNQFAETYSSTSRCFRHGASWIAGTSDVSATAGAGCYQYTCSASEGLRVFILGTKIDCQCEGKEVFFEISGSGQASYRGSIICPSCRDLCWDTENTCPASPMAACPGMTETLNSTAPSSSPAVRNGRSSVALATAALLLLACWSAQW